MKTLFKRSLLVCAVIITMAMNVKADTTPDASSVVTTATTTFNTVGGLVASIVGFFIIVKIVKWIRK